MLIEGHVDHERIRTWDIRNLQEPPGTSDATADATADATSDAAVDGEGCSPVIKGFPGYASVLWFATSLLPVCYQCRLHRLHRLHRLRPLRRLRLDMTFRTIHHVTFL